VTGGDLVEEVVPLGALDLAVLRPRDSEALLDEHAFAQEEFLPYWAELWPSGVALARALAGRSLRGARTLELGCGLALPSITAALAGGRVTATDWSAAALDFAADNAARNGARIETLRCSWAQPGPLLARAPWDLVLAADVLYERRDVAPLLDLLPRLGGVVLLADPGRPPLAEFLAGAGAVFDVTATPDPVARHVALHRLAPRAAG